jgi:hypothetical protein
MKNVACIWHLNKFCELFTQKEQLSAVSKIKSLIAACIQQNKLFGTVWSLMWTAWLKAWKEENTTVYFLHLNFIPYTNSVQQIFLLHFQPPWGVVHKITNQTVPLRSSIRKNLWTQLTVNVDGRLEA